MHFDARDIRVSMDVYTADDVYLGSVLRLPGVTTREPGDDNVVVGPEDRSSLISGEALGPEPTEVFGNQGPSTQSAAKEYASIPDEDRIITSGSFEVGKWWGLMGRRSIPLEYVQAVSMDLVRLRLTDGEIG